MKARSYAALLIAASALVVLFLLSWRGHEQSPKQIMDAFVREKRSVNKCDTSRGDVEDTFNSKILWRMKHDHRRIWGIVVDKLHSKDYATRIKGVEAVPTWWSARVHPSSVLGYVGHGYDPGQARAACSRLPPLESLPGHSFAFKASHTALCNLIVGNGTVVAHRRCALPPPSWVPGAGALRGWLFSLFGSQFIDREPSLVGKRATRGMLQKQCVAWLNQRYYRASEEWAYAEADEIGGRGVLIEPTLRNPFANPSPPHLAADLKCYTFAGRTRILHYVAGRFVSKGGEQLKKDTFFLYTPPPSSSSPRRARDGGEWALLNVTIDGSSFDTDRRRMPPAAVLNGVRKKCNAVGAQFDFARVDFLWSRGGGGGGSGGGGGGGAGTDGDGDDALHLGEITPYPGGGFHHWQGTPSLNSLMSKSWCLPTA